MKKIALIAILVGVSGSIVSPAQAFNMALFPGFGGNVAAVHQEGRNNEQATQQDGRNNHAYTQQFGRNNFAVTNQIGGQNHFSWVFQTGSGNLSTVVQKGW